MENRSLQATGKLTLSVAIIFRNEMRCLERCLKSLTPLRERVPCEIIMADTGSDDGSREIAEQYADTLFDFPWIDDFAAARNATLNRCAGEWILFLDCDEWFEDVEELARFLEKDAPPSVDKAMFVIRNYLFADAKENYADFVTTRMLRRSWKPRFAGAIHEYVIVEKQGGHALFLQGVILHHDGYVCFNDDSPEGVRKRQRNVRLLRREMEREPQNLRSLLQFISCGREEPDYMEQIERGLSLTVANAPGWREYGPSIFSRAVTAAYKYHFPTLREWAGQAERMFPDSYFIRIDVNAILCVCDYEQEDFAAALRHGEGYLNARKELSRNPSAFLQNAAYYGPLRLNNEAHERQIRIIVIRSAVRIGKLKDFAGAVRELRLILESAPELKEEIQDAVREIQAKEKAPPEKTPPELLELAEQVRKMLAAYPPDDPTLALIKASPVYQKFAPLIEASTR